MSIGLKPKLNEQTQATDPLVFLKNLVCRPALISIVLGLATAWVFLPVKSNDFVNYDDPEYVTSNQHVQNGITWKNLKWAFTSGDASNWHPLTWVSHMLDWQMFGSRAGPQHLMSVGFHLANTVLLFLLLRRTTRAVWR